MIRSIKRFFCYPMDYLKAHIRYKRGQRLMMRHALKLALGNTGAQYSAAHYENFSKTHIVAL